MEVDRHTGLEEALARTERDADAALGAANAVVRSLKKFRAASHTGDLRELRRTLDAVDQAATALRREVDSTRAGWDFDEESYFADGAFTRELLETAAQNGLKIFPEDDRLYCYPFLMRILAGERAVLIDKARERRLRPSFLVDHLKALQGKPVRFKPEAFLESLASAYDTAVATRGAARAGRHPDVPLREIYDLLTLLPGQSREYPRQEFARDIYLLDRSGVTTTRGGRTVSFPASTGTKSKANTITVITPDGGEKKYFGIAFTAA